tara:strand:- start:929 stop:3931 length:3003 start_codon:yes stop_codon:yes gene_type:complete
MPDNQRDNQTESEYAGDSWATGFDKSDNQTNADIWEDENLSYLEKANKISQRDRDKERWAAFAKKVSGTGKIASRKMTGQPGLETSARLKQSPYWTMDRSEMPKNVMKAYGIKEHGPLSKYLGLQQKEGEWDLGYQYTMDPSLDPKGNKLPLTLPATDFTPELGLSGKDLWKDQWMGIDLERLGPEGMSSQPLEGEYLTPEEAAAKLLDEEAHEYNQRLGIGELDPDILSSEPGRLPPYSPGYSTVEEAVEAERSGYQSLMTEEQIAAIAEQSGLSKEDVKDVVADNIRMPTVEERNRDNELRHQLEQAKDFERIIDLRQQYRALKEEEIRLKKGQEDIVLESNLKQQAHLTAADEREEAIKKARAKLWEDWKAERTKGTALSNKLLEYAGIKMVDGKAVDIGDGMGGWEIFKKASLAVGAIIAAGATVVGQAALSSEGVAMPNVFMPLILKAIDADIASMRREKAGFVDDAGHLVRYTQEMRSIFSTERETLTHMQTAGLKYTKGMIAREKARLNLKLEGSGTKAEALNRIENALQREIVKKQLDEAVQQRTKIEQMVQAGVQTRGSAATLELTRSNLDNARLKAVQLRKKLYGTKDDKLTGAESQVTNQRITTLQPIMRLKERLGKLFIQTTSHGLFEDTNIEEWATMKASDFWPKLARTYETEKIGLTEVAEIKKQLRSLQRVTAKRMEGRLTGPDWEFYERNLGIGPAEAGGDWTTSILTIINTLSRVEYEEKLKILTSLTALTPQGQARWAEKFEPISNRTLNDVMNGFKKTIKQDIITGEGKFVPFDVGVADIPLPGELNVEVLQNAVNGWKRLVVSPNSNERSEVFQLKKKMAEDEKRNRKPLLTFEDLVPVRTKEGKPAYLPKEFAERWKRFSHYVLAKTNGKVNLMLRGHRSGGRNAEMIQSLKKDKYNPARRGGHTEHGGFRDFDVYLGEGNPYDSPIYKAMVMYGPAAGIERDHDLETDTEKSLGRKPYYGAWHFTFLDLKSSPKEKRG